jgi:exosortase A
VNTVHQRAAWRAAVVSLTALLALTFFLYQQTIWYLIGKWNQLELGEYGHGYLVLLISVYLVFYNRHRLVALTPCPEYRAILAVLASSMLWLVAALVDIEVLQAVGLLLLVLCIMWVLLGTRVIQVLAFPVLFIGFAIPVWFPLSPILQELTADIVFWLIRLIEIPGLRIDNMIVLPAGRLSIEEACSGLRYFLAALTLGTLFAYLNYVTFRARLIVVMISAGAGVLANILRVFIVVYLGYTTDMQHSLITDHLMFGWYLFGGIVVVLLVIDTYLHRLRLHSTNDDANTAVVKPAAYNQAPCNMVKLQFMVIVISGALLVSLGPAMVFWINNQPPSVSSPAQFKPFSMTGEWSVIDSEEDGWNPLYRGAIAHKMAFHDKNNRVIHLYLGMYPTQRQGEELISDLNRISDDKIWHIRYQREKVYNFNGQQVLEQLLEKNDGTQRLVWYWYRVAGQNTVNKYKAKALQALGMLKGMRQASIVAIAANLDGEPEDTRRILDQFAKKMDASIESVTDSKI